MTPAQFQRRRNVRSSWENMMPIQNLNSTNIITDTRKEILRRVQQKRFRFETSKLLCDDNDDGNNAWRCTHHVEQENAHECWIHLSETVTSVNETSRKNRTRNQSTWQWNETSRYVTSWIVSCCCMASEWLWPFGSAQVLYVERKKTNTRDTNNQTVHHTQQVHHTVHTSSIGLQLQERHTQTWRDLTSVTTTQFTRNGDGDVWMKLAVMWSCAIRRALTWIESDVDDAIQNSNSWVRLIETALRWKSENQINMPHLSRNISNKFDLKTRCCLMET